MLDIGIVIVNYNVASLLRKCLRSVMESKGVALSVCVVDNCSSDGSVAMVREEFPLVHVIENPMNCGYAAANNAGLRFFFSEMPVCRYLLLLNPDTELPPDALQNMVAFMDSRPDVGVAGPMLVLPDGKLDLACRRSFPTPTVFVYRALGFSRLFPKSKRFARYNLTYLDPKQTVEVDAVVGAFMMVRREAIKHAGMLDEDFFMYGEDLDWSYRIKQLGWTVMYYPQVTVLHHKGESSKQVRTRATSEFYRAMRVFYRKHYYAQNVFLINWLMLGAIHLRGNMAYVANLLRPAGKRRMI